MTDIFHHSLLTHPIVATNLEESLEVFKRTAVIRNTLTNMLVRCLIFIGTCGVIISSFSFSSLACEVRLIHYYSLVLSFKVSEFFKLLVRRLEGSNGMEHH